MEFVHFGCTMVYLESSNFETWRDWNMTCNKVIKIRTCINEKAYFWTVGSIKHAQKLVKQLTLPWLIEVSFTGRSIIPGLASLWQPNAASNLAKIGMTLANKVGTSMSFMVERCFDGLIGYSVPSSKHQACPLSEAWKASERSGEGPTASCHEHFFSGPSGKDLLYNFSASQCGVGCKMLDNAWGAEMPGKPPSSLTISMKRSQLQSC